MKVFSCYFCFHVNKAQRYVKMTYFKGHSTAISCISPNFNDIFPISAAMDDIKIWMRTGHTGEQGACVWMRLLLLLNHATQSNPGS